MVRDQYIFSLKVFPKDRSIHILRHMADGLGLGAVVEYTSLKQGFLDAGAKMRSCIEEDELTDENDQPILEKQPPLIITKETPRIIAPR